MSPKLTPGERFKNWCEGAVKLWPIILPLIGGTIYGNSETVKEFFRPPPTVEDVQPPTNPAYYRKSIEDIIAKLNNLETNSEAIRAQLSEKDAYNYRELEKRISELREEILKIQELVN